MTYKRTPINSLEGKTIAFIKINNRGSYVFYNRAGRVLFTVGGGWIFDRDGMYFDTANLEFLTDEARTEYDK